MEEWGSVLQATILLPNRYFDYWNYTPERQKEYMKEIASFKNVIVNKQDQMLRIDIWDHRKRVSTRYGAEAVPLKAQFQSWNRCTVVQGHRPEQF